MTASQRTPGRRTRIRKAAVLLVTVLCIALSLTGCQINGTAPDDLGHAWASTCPKDKKVAAALDIDVSGSASVTEVSGGFEQALRDRAARVGMCGGRLRVSAFAGSNAGTETLFDGTVTVKGSTTNAKARLLLAAVDAVVEAVGQKFPLNTAAMAPGSDIVGQLWNAQTYASQLGDGYVLDLVIQTDGLDTKTLPTREIVDTATAATAAQAVRVPQLPGAWVTITGLGEVAGTPVDTTVTEALTTFYGHVCKRTGVARCVVAVDYVSPVGGEGS
ncbi:MAG: hypothetical protein QM655_11630 [Nocardioidaceae bacterium]